MPKREAAMTRMEFREALKVLDSSAYRIAILLGVSQRHAHRYASGESPIPRPVAIVLRQLVAAARRKAVRASQ